MYPTVPNMQNYKVESRFLLMSSSQVRAAQVMRCLASANAATYRLPATRLSGCKTGAPYDLWIESPILRSVLIFPEISVYTQ